MDDHEGRHLDRDTAERLLDGARVTRPAGPVADLLARASAPGQAHELSKEDSVVLAFRAVAREYPRSSWWRRLFTFKVIVAVLATVTAGGLAFASTTGIIPKPAKQSPPAPSPSSPAPRGPRPTAPAPEPNRVITEAEVHGLCKSYLEKVGEERGRALESPAFKRLVDAAGGANAVDAYCGEKTTGNDKTDKSPQAKTPTARPSRTPASEQGRRP